MVSHGTVPNYFVYIDAIYSAYFHESCAVEYL